MAVLQIIFFVLLIGALLIGVLRGATFLFACAFAPFSKQYASIVRNRPLAHAIWGILGVFSLILLLGFFGFNPPGFYYVFSRLERAYQRHVSFARVQAAGGWENVKKESEDILGKHKGENFLWHKWETNMPPLSASLAALKPQIVSIDERKDLPPILRIEMFGMWHTGGQPTPYYGIWITRYPVVEGFDPQSLIRGEIGLIGASQVHYITNQIYEIY